MAVAVAVTAVAEVVAAEAGTVVAAEAVAGAKAVAVATGAAEAAAAMAAFAARTAQGLVAVEAAAATAAVIESSCRAYSRQSPAARGFFIGAGHCASACPKLLSMPAPSPDHALPCMHASTFGCNAASFSIMRGASLVCEK
jgi:hypothetical protein